MLGGEPPKTRAFGATWQLKYGSIAFAEGNDIPPVLHRRQEVTKTPDAALVQSMKRLAAFEPKLAQFSGALGITRLPGRIEHFQQFAAMDAAEVLLGTLKLRGASDAAQLTSPGCRGYECFGSLSH